VNAARRTPSFCIWLCSVAGLSPSRGAVAPVDLRARRPERALDGSSHRPVQGAGIGAARRREREVVRQLERATASQDERGLEDVGELAHVPRPIMGGEPRHHRARDRRLRQIEPRCQLAEERGHQRREILAPFPERPEPECPAEAIYLDRDVPADRRIDIERNARFFRR
jgi:hypothetical protein